MSVLAIEGLTKSFRGFTAVNHVSLDLQSGELRGLIGAASEIAEIAYSQPDNIEQALDQVGHMFGGTSDDAPGLSPRHRLVTLQQLRIAVDGVQR